MAKVLVLGATGRVGTAALAELARRGIGARAASRDPAAAQQRVAAEEVVRFDLERPETFDAALAGIERVLLMARPGDEQADRIALPLIARMQAAGVRHVVNLTAMGTERRPDFALRRVELALEASSMACTHLRPNWFMQILSADPLRRAIAAGVIRIPAGDACVSYVDARDVGAVAGSALAEPGHEGAAYTLTGPAALDHAAIARAIARAAEIAVEYQPIDEDTARAELARAGFPPPWVERLVGFYRLLRAGLCAPVTGDVERVLGRPPIPFARFAAEHSGLWRS